MVQTGSSERELFPLIRVCSLVLDFWFFVWFCFFIHLCSWLVCNSLCKLPWPKYSLVFLSYLSILRQGLNCPGWFSSYLVTTAASHVLASVSQVAEFIGFDTRPCFPSISSYIYLFRTFCFPYWCWGLNPGPYPCYASTLPMRYFPRLVLFY